MYMIKTVDTMCIVCYSYKHAVDGLIRVYGEEGFTKLFSGATMATTRAVLMTVGQVSICPLVSVTYISFFAVLKLQ